MLRWGAATSSELPGPKTVGGAINKTRRWRALTSKFKVSRKIMVIGNRPTLSDRCLGSSSLGYHRVSRAILVVLVSPR
jgi:hypothetical protein